MIFQNKKFKVVIIDCPIFALNDDLCSSIFGHSLQMKIEGYHSTYSDSVLPLDKADFFGTHIIFGEENGDKFIPIFSYKATPLDRCLKYNYEFPAHTSIKNDAHPSCLKDINKIIEQVGDPRLISFDSSWAQNIKYRSVNNPDLKQFFKEIMMMVIVRHHQEFNLPHMFTCGVVKVKTDLFFLNLGLNKLNAQSHYNQKSMDNEELVFFYNDSFSPLAYSLADKHQGLWENKLLIDGLAINRRIKERESA